MKSVNTIHLLGNVGRDPEVRYTPSGTAIASFSLATSSRKKTQSGDYQDVTQWHNCVCFQKLAEIVSQYVRKGGKIYVSGTLEYQEYDREGVKVKVAKIIVNELSMLSSSENNQPRSTQQEQEPLSVPSSSAALDDDIPF